MNYKTKIYTALLPTLLLCTGTTRCSLLDEDIDDTFAVGDSVSVDFAFSLNCVQQTRMSTDIVQSADGSFRGLSEIHLYPFLSNTKVRKTDSPKLFDIHAIGTSFDASSQTPGAYYYYYTKQDFMTGVGAFLAYARAAKATSLSPNATASQMIEYKARYGSLVCSGLNNETPPADISFALEQIYPSTSVPDEASKLAEYLTYIATTSVEYTPDPTNNPTDTYTYTWATVEQPQLQALYQNFINMIDATETALMAGSAANVKIFVNELYSNVSNMTDPDEQATWPLPVEWDGAAEALCDAILSRISTPSPAISGFTFDDANGCITSLGVLDDYPRDLGLPDGAAAVKWNLTSSRFVPQTTTTSVADINSLQRFAYPAELYYFANSLIKTSMTDNRSQYYLTTNSWTDILAGYEVNNAVIVPHTKSAALIDPLQYAVAHLEVQLNRQTTATLPDANGNPVPVAEAGTPCFPLKAIIVGGQRPVQFDFTLDEDEGDDDLCFVYDPVHSDITILPPSDDASASQVTTSAHTMVLQNKDDEEVTVIAEFENNSSVTFRGMDGMIYPNTRFYLVGKVKPDDPETPDTRDDYEKRVFTQDYTTTMQMTISRLAKAYNVLPNIMSPRLEIGIEITPWQEVKGTNVSLD